jgi:hypothetical protein
MDFTLCRHRKGKRVMHLVWKETVLLSGSADTVRNNCVTLLKKDIAASEKGCRCMWCCRTLGSCQENTVWRIRYGHGCDLELMMSAASRLAEEGVNEF